MGLACGVMGCTGMVILCCCVGPYSHWVVDYPLQKPTPQIVLVAMTIVVSYWQSEQELLLPQLCNGESCKKVVQCFVSMLQQPWEHAFVMSIYRLQYH